MHLNHLDLPVPDLAAAVDFFVAGFGFTVIARRDGDGMVILRDDDGFVLVLTQAAEPAYPESFHIGFLQPSDAAVHATYQRLIAAHVDVPKPPAVMYGCLQFYCSVPGGILVEISHRSG